MSPAISRDGQALLPAMQECYFGLGQVRICKTRGDDYGQRTPRCVPLPAGAQISRENRSPIRLRQSAVKGGSWDLGTLHDDQVEATSLAEWPSAAVAQSMRNGPFLSETRVARVAHAGHAFRSLWCRRLQSAPCR